MNLIEQLFPKTGHELRKAAKRSKDTVCDTIAAILAPIAYTECKNYFANAGYELV